MLGHQTPPWQVKSQWSEDTSYFPSPCDVLRRLPFYLSHKQVIARVSMQERIPLYERFHEQVLRESFRTSGVGKSDF